MKLEWIIKYKNIKTNICLIAKTSITSSESIRMVWDHKDTNLSKTQRK